MARHAMFLAVAPLLPLLMLLTCTPPAEAIPNWGKAILSQHNTYRARHGASPLTLSTSLQAAATSYAKRCGGLTHDQSIRGKQEENLYITTDSNPDSAVRSAIRSWYAEESKYNYGSGGFSMATGHFTQVVWKGSRQLGCGYAKCRNSWPTTTLVVCRYSPPGNYAGQYARNVGRPQSGR